MAVVIRVTTLGCMVSILLLFQSCFQKKENVLKRRGVVTLATEETSESVTATVVGNSSVMQTLQTSESGTLGGTSISFPPGSLAVDTLLVLKEGATLATSGTAAELGLKTGFTTVGVAVSIQPTTAIDAARPFTISIPLPASSPLHLADATDKLIILYKVNQNDKAQIALGAIAQQDLTIGPRYVSFKTSYFGVYQVAYSDTAIEKGFEVATEGAILTKDQAKALPALSITGRRPLVVKAGDTVEISGANFRPGIVLALGGTKIAKVTMSDAKLSFTAPSSSTHGLNTLLVNQDSFTQEISLIYKPNDDYPVITLSETDVCASQKYYDLNGDLHTGTRNCTASDLSALTPGVLKSGVTVAGVAGAYPSVNYPLAGADSTADLDTATFDAKMKSATSFEWFDSAGNRYTNTGDADIAPGNIVSGVTIFGTVGSIASCSGDGQTECLTTMGFPSADSSAYSTWDIRKGKTVGGKVGLLTFYKNMIGSFDNTIAPAAAGNDVWDTMDDYANGGAFPTGFPTGWNQATGANWVMDTTNDTGSGGGVALDGLCNGSEACVFKDQVTGLMWAKDTALTYTWQGAISYCDNLVYGGYSDWRLSTQKELMQAYVDGIWSLKAADKLVNLSMILAWTATTQSANTSSAWLQTLDNGGTNLYDKGSSYELICVRP